MLTTPRKWTEFHTFFQIFKFNREIQRLKKRNFSLKFKLFRILHLVGIPGIPKKEPPLRTRTQPRPIISSNVDYYSCYDD